MVNSSSGTGGCAKYQKMSQPWHEDLPRVHHAQLHSKKIPPLPSLPFSSYEPRIPNRSSCQAPNNKGPLGLEDGNLSISLTINLLEHYSLL